MTKHIALIACAIALGVVGGAQAQQNAMTFFVTSAGPGKGGDLGGLDGADRHCQKLAQAAGGAPRPGAPICRRKAPARSTPRTASGAGRGRTPRATVIAKDVADLHGANNKINKQSALTRRAEPINGRGDTPNRHDILTGSQPDGTAFAGGDDRTCGNWTSSGAGAAMVGHHDRMGLNEELPRSRGIPRIPRAGRAVAARRRTCGAPAATACSTASRPTECPRGSRQPGLPGRRSRHQTCRHPFSDA